MGENAKIILQIYFTESLLRRSYRDFLRIIEEGRNYDTKVYTS
jgi:hypothetical protein